MASLALILIFVLQFGAGISVEPIYLYKRSGRDVVVPCSREPLSNTTCSNVFWFYSNDRSLSTPDVDKGKVQKSSARAARLSLGTDCSLVINKITAEDVGYYICRLGMNNYQDVVIYLSVLTISPSNPDADSKKNGEVTLECSLTKHIGINRCEQNSLRWVDETGTVLDGEGVGYKVKQMNCFSYLTVKRQSGHNRTYTCQFVDEGKMEVEAHYTPVFTDGKTDDQPATSNSNWQLSYIMLSLRITGLILIIVITALLIRDRMKTKPLDNDNNVRQDGDEVSYENVEARPATARLH